MFIKLTVESGFMESESESDDGQVFNPRWSIANLLKVDVIREEILSYLNFQDLKFFSEASRETLAAVRNSKKYKKITRLVISPNAVEKDLDSVKSLASIWTGKDLKMEAVIPIKFLQLRPVGQLLNKIKSLTLRISNEYKAKAGDELVGKFIAKALEKTKSLKRLELDPTITILCQKSPSPDISDSYQWLSALASSNLKNLETLEIKEDRRLSYIPDFEPDLQMSIILGNLVSVGNLKKLKFYYQFRRFHRYVYSHKISSEYERKLLELIKKNKDSLEDLELGDSEVWRLDGAEIADIHIPKLKRLTLSVSHIEVTLERFVAHQPQLDLLSFSLRVIFPMRIIKAIEGKQSKLKDLRIRTSYFAPVDGQMDWSFLKKFTQLECFVIRKGKNGNRLPAMATVIEDGYGEDIMRCLPPSVKILVLEGFKSFWRKTTPPSERNIGRSLSHLVNLEELSLRLSSDALNDEGLQDLIRNCPNLTALSFSHCADISSYGVTGVEPMSGDPIGVSLDQFTRLRYLRIQSCPGINRKDLLSVAKFKFLTYLYFDGGFLEEFIVRQKHRNCVQFNFENRQRNMRFLAQLLHQNLCLEKLRVRLAATNQREEDEVKENYRRINHVNFLCDEGLENYYDSLYNDGDLPLQR